MLALKNKTITCYRFILLRKKENSHSDFDLTVADIVL